MPKLSTDKALVKGSPERIGVSIGVAVADPLDELTFTVGQGKRLPVAAVTAPPPEKRYKYGTPEWARETWCAPCPECGMAPGGVHGWRCSWWTWNPDKTPFDRKPAVLLDADDDLPF